MKDAAWLRSRMSPMVAPVEMSISTAGFGAPASAISAGDVLASRRVTIALGSCPWLVFAPELP
jgi:hypothetical protein